MRMRVKHGVLSSQPADGDNGAVGGLADGLGGLGVRGETFQVDCVAFELVALGAAVGVSFEDLFAEAFARDFDLDAGVAGPDAIDARGAARIFNDLDKLDLELPGVKRLLLFRSKGEFLWCLSVSALGYTHNYRQDHYNGY